VSISILVVCTGNLCRSPAAEVLLSDRLDGLPMITRSAGTSGVTGHAMDTATAYAVSELGIDPSHHVARRVTPSMVEEADLILTADTMHRSIVVQTVPLAFRRTFTLREFARLGAGMPPLPEYPSPDRLRERIAAVAALRGVIDAAEPGGDDIGDPLGGGLEVARSTVAVIDDAVTGIVHALGLDTYVHQAAPLDPAAEERPA
jgi:protein-tyrosine phosphatase